MGRRQVVRHQFLVLAFGGSNPSAPAKHKQFILVTYYVSVMPMFLSADRLSDLPESYTAFDVVELKRDALVQGVVQAIDTKVPKLCSVRELQEAGTVRIETAGFAVIVAASKNNDETHRPARLFYGAGTDTEILDVYGAVEGTQAYGFPFIGYIETRQEVRLMGLAKKVLPVLNNVTRAVYGMPLTSGPQYYFSEDGAALCENIEASFNLSRNHNGFVEGIQQS
ncbi:MAG: hypothetical protein JWO41_708 [Candidatus Saccharibacteria bacterium]|nr:hypothetical protein [Candidatus Saccharibacteria bacterium]